LAGQQIDQATAVGSEIISEKMKIKLVEAQNGNTAAVTEKTCFGEL
jgi:hypothetical protein